MGESGGSFKDQSESTRVFLSLLRSWGHWYMDDKTECFDCVPCSGSLVSWDTSVKIQVVFLFFLSFLGHRSLGSPAPLFTKIKLVLLKVVLLNWYCWRAFIKFGNIYDIYTYVCVYIKPYEVVGFLQWRKTKGQRGQGPWAGKITRAEFKPRSVWINPFNFFILPSLILESHCSHLHRFYSHPSAALCILSRMISITPGFSYNLCIDNHQNKCLLKVV